MARACGPRTRAIVPVHLYGQCADLEPLLELARERGLAVVDDAAQAHGAELGGRRVGALCDATAFSFYPTKNLGALGDGGAVVTDDSEVAERVRRLRSYGEADRYRSVGYGRNSRLAALQAAALRVKLPRLEAWNERRRQLAGRYRDELRAAELVLPVERPGTRARLASLRRPAPRPGRSPRGARWAKGSRRSFTILGPCTSIPDTPRSPTPVSSRARRWPRGAEPAALSAAVGRRARAGVRRARRGSALSDLRWKLKWLVKAVTPPIIILGVKTALIRLGLRRPDEQPLPPEPVAPEPEPEWEYVPEGWARTAGDPSVKGWDVAAVGAAYREKWPGSYTRSRARVRSASTTRSPPART